MNPSHLTTGPSGYQKRSFFSSASAIPFPTSVLPLPCYDLSLNLFGIKRSCTSQLLPKSCRPLSTPTCLLSVSFMVSMIQLVWVISTMINVKRTPRDLGDLQNCYDVCGLHSHRPCELGDLHHLCGVRDLHQAGSAGCFASKSAGPSTCANNSTIKGRGAPANTVAISQQSQRGMSV